MIQKKGCPRTCQPPAHNVKEESCHQRTENGDTYESIHRHNGGPAAPPQDPRANQTVTRGILGKGADNHDSTAHSESCRIIGVKGKHFFTEDDNRSAGDGGKDKSPLDTFFPIGIPFFFTVLSDRLPCGDHTRFAETSDIAPVDVGNIHADIMNHKGYRSQAGNHSCKERHTCPLTDLFAEYGKEEGCHSFEIRFVWKKRAAAKEFIPFHNDHSPVKAAKCAENGSDSSARDAQRRERAHAKDEQKIHNDIYDVSKDIAFHNSRRMPEAELDGLEQGGHRRDKNGNNGYLPIGQRLRHVFRFRAHKKEYVFQIKIENTVNWQKDGRADEE